MEMPGRVRVLRVVATTNMSTGETEAQVNPGITGFQTILAAVCTRGDLLYLVEMRTVFCHQSFPSIHPGRGEILVVAMLLLEMTHFIKPCVNCSPCNGVYRVLTVLYNVTLTGASSHIRRAPTCLSPFRKGHAALFRMIKVRCDGT